MTDTIRLVMTYVIAVLVLIGAFALIYQGRGDTGQAWLTIGLVTGFVFNKESTTSGARQTERAVTLGSTASVAPPPPAIGGTV